MLDRPLHSASGREPGRAGGTRPVPGRSTAVGASQSAQPRELFSSCRDALDTRAASVPSTVAVVGMAAVVSAAVGMAAVGALSTVVVGTSGFVRFI